MLRLIIDVYEKPTGVKSSVIVAIDQNWEGRDTATKVEVAFGSLFAEILTRASKAIMVDAHSGSVIEGLNIAEQVQEMKRRLGI